LLPGVSVLSVDDPVEHALGPVSGIFQDNPPMGLRFHHVCGKPRGFNFDRSGVCGHGVICRIRAGHNGDQGVIETYFRKD